MKERLSGSKSRFKDKRKRKQARSTVPRPGPGVLGRLPEIDAQLIVSKKVRYQLGSGSTTLATFSMTSQSLVGAFFMAIGSSSGYSLFQAVRLKSIKAWLNPVALGPATLQLFYPPQVVSSSVPVGAEPGKRIQDTVVGVTSTCYVAGAPDPDSQSGCWFNTTNYSSSNTIAQLFVELGSAANIALIVDVTFEAVLFNGFSSGYTPLSVSIASATGAAGRVYASPLWASVPGTPPSLSSGLAIGWDQT